MPIYELHLENVGPFDEIHFEFDPQMNVFVGPNNCGKSSVLMALADIVVYPFSIPKKLLKRAGGRYDIYLGVTSRDRMQYGGTLPSGLGPPQFPYELTPFKEIGHTCFIPALRWNTDYRAESPMSEKRKQNADGEYRIPNLPSDLAKRANLLQPDASVVPDDVLVQKMIDLDYRAYREGNPRIREIVGKTAAIASEITDGFPIEFAGIGEDRNGLYPEFKTPDGKVPINVLSQGTQSIIQWLGHLLIGYAEYYGFRNDLETPPGVVIIDEIDAHMHPSWQRRILPTLSRNFPNLQVFCSSHSPLVLAGLKAGQAHLLKRDSKGKVTVSRNETDIVGWSTDEILRNFLDIANPTDLQTNDDIQRLGELRSKRRLTKKQKEELEDLRSKVNQNLLAGPVAGEMERFVEMLRKPPPESPPSKKQPPPKKRKKASTGSKRQGTAARRRTQR